MTIYRYGAIAWIWRVLMAGAGTAGAGLLILALRFNDPWFVAMALPLLAPTLALGWMVATRIDVRGDRLEVRTLGFVPRRIAISRLGKPHLRLTAALTYRQISAPRLWIPVRGGLPVYVDLLAEIPDLDAFTRIVPLSPALRGSLQRD